MEYILVCKNGNNSIAFVYGVGVFDLIFFPVYLNKWFFMCIFFLLYFFCVDLSFFKSMNFVKKIYKHAYKLYNDFNAVATHIQFDFPSVLKVLSYVGDLFFFSNK